MFFVMAMTLAVLPILPLTILLLTVLTLAILSLPRLPLTILSLALIVMSRLLILVLKLAPCERARNGSQETVSQLVATRISRGATTQSSQQSSLSLWRIRVYWPTL